MKMPECCAALKIEFRIEYFHGSDDDYELHVPVLVCPICKKEFRAFFEPEPRTDT